jgi:hypothetical protein
MRNVCSVLLAVFWLVASSHPVLESAGLIHHHNDSDTHSPATPAHSDDGDSDHDAADGKCPTTFARVSIPDPPQIECALFSFACGVLLNRVDVEIESSGLAPPIVGPTPLSSRHFAFRTALAPRAPSSIS